MAGSGHERAESVRGELANAGRVDVAVPGQGEQDHTDESESRPGEGAVTVSADGCDGEGPRNSTATAVPSGMRWMASRKTTVSSAVGIPSASRAGRS